MLLRGLSNADGDKRELDRGDLENLLDDTMEAHRELHTALAA